MPIFDGRIVSDEYFDRIIRGPQGETGLQGVNGFQGVTGLQGIQGTTGLSSSVQMYFNGLISSTSQIRIFNTNIETTILETTLPIDRQKSGACFRFRFQGTHQNQASSGTLIFRMYIGDIAGQLIQLNSQSSARSQTFCEFEGFATIRETGTNGNFITTGRYSYLTSATAQVHAYQGGSTTTIVNTTQENNIKITAKWATASLTNILTIQNAFIEQIKN